MPVTPEEKKAEKMDEMHGVENPPSAATTDPNNPVVPDPDNSDSERDDIDEMDTSQWRAHQARLDRNTARLVSVLGLIVLAVIVGLWALFSWLIGSGGDEQEGVRGPDEVESSVRLPGPDGDGSGKSDGDDARASADPSDSEERTEALPPKEQTAADYDVPELMYKTDTSFLNRSWRVVDDPAEVGVVTDAVQGIINEIPLPPEGEGVEGWSGLPRVAADYTFGNQAMAQFYQIAALEGWHVANVQVFEHYADPADHPLRTAFTFTDADGNDKVFFAGVYEPVTGLFELDTYSATVGGPVF